MSFIEGTAENIDARLAQEITQNCGEEVRRALRLGKNDFFYSPDMEPYWTSSEYK